MRNLNISSVQRWEVTSEAANDQPFRPSPSSITLDVDEQAIYCALEAARPVAAGSPSRSSEITLIRIVDGQVSPLKSYVPLEALPDDYPQAAPLVLSFQFLPETRNLVLALANGEIAQYPVDDPSSEWDVVGAFEGGLQAAEWSPDGSLLMLATGDGKLVQMTTEFDALYEKNLRPFEFGEDAQVNVNWGSKATQFHGSLGKAAAASASQPQARVGSSPDDDQRVRISWRGDAAFFVVSTLDAYDHEEGIVSPQSRRVLRVYDRDTALRATLEPTAGLEHVLSWRPSGNFIATSQRLFGADSGYHGGGVGRPGRHDVVFFERNGLRRLEYEGKWSTLSTVPTSPLDWDYKIREMSWSCDSNILGIWISRKDCDVFQIWTTGNWHWYLKLEIRPAGATRFSNASWHPERPKVLFLSSDSGLLQYDLEYETCASHAPDGVGMIAVVDRGNALLTPFRLQNVPPPAASHTLSLHESKSPPIHLSLSSCGELLASLSYTTQQNVEVTLWNLHPRQGPGRGRIMSPQCLVNQKVDMDIPLQIVIDDGASGQPTILVLHQGLGCGGKITSYMLQSNQLEEVGTISCPPNGRLISASNRSGVLWQSREGTIHDARTMGALARFPVFCFDAQSFAVSGVQHVAGLANGKLYIASVEHSGAHLLSSNVSSFIVSGSFLIYITTAHESVYAPLKDLSTLLDADKEGEGTDTATRIVTVSNRWEKRRVERGSRIVTTVPSSMSVVLQMPRGNLETIYPRPLALEVIRSDIQRREYGKAFSACRKHRIDLGILVEQDSERFVKDIPLFVEQVPDVDDINLFLTAIGRSNSPELIRAISDQIRRTLQQIDTVRYIQCVLTSYVVETPPRHEDALAHLHQLREEHSQIVEDAVRYIIFLVDADKLFDIALGMYDFALVLLIAQHSQRDPREYLPFLRELKALDRPLQRFRIDDHLRRYAKALRNLSEGGPKYFEQATNYMEKHQLYAEGLEIWQGHPEEYQVVMELYGDWLFDRREFENAALAFEVAKKPPKAMLAYEKAHDWRRLFDLALRHQKDTSKLQEMAYRVAEDLCGRKRWTEAAIIYAEYAEDVEESVRAYTNGNELGDALRLVAKSSNPELGVNIVHPGALDLCSQFSDDLEEMEAQLEKQYTRIKELRRAKQENPDAFFGAEDTTLHNVDVTTDVSTPFTTFTRYTVAQTNTSRGTKRTSRSKRKLDMKNAAGRRGTVEEESYILASWSKLASRLTSLQNEAGKLLPYLRLFSTEHSEEGKKLQNAIIDLETRFNSIVEEIWAEEIPQSDSTPSPTTNTNKPPKPVFGSRSWVIPNQFWL